MIVSCLDSRHGNIDNLGPVLAVPAVVAGTQAISNLRVLSLVDEPMAEHNGAATYHGDLMAVVQLQVWDIHKLFRVGTRSIRLEGGGNGMHFSSLAAQLMLLNLVGIFSLQ